MRLVPWLILALAICLFVWHASTTQFLQDDSYITYRYARNVARGIGPVFNTGERVEGYTNFLWMMLLAFLGIIGIPFTTIIPLSQVIGVFCGIGVILIFFFFIRRHSTGPPALAPLAALFLAANGSFAYWCVSGMESGLFSLFLAAACFVYLGSSNRSSLIGTSLLLGLSALTRPEGALFWGAVILHFIIRRLAADRSHALSRASFGDLALLLAPFIVMVAPLYIWRLGYYGWLFPNTFYAKTGLASSYLKSGIRYLVDFYKAYGFWGLALVVPVLLGLKYRDRLPRLPFVFALLVLVVHALYTVSVGGDVLRIYRFFVPVYFLFYFVLSEGIWLIPTGTVVRTALLILLVPLTFWGPLMPGKSVRREINFNKYLERGLVDKMSATGRWLNRHLAEDEWFACTTIGAISWFSDRNLVDMLGLTDAVIAHEPEDILGARLYWKERNYNTRHVLERKPQYIYFSTGGKPSAAAERALFLRKRFRVGYFPCLVSMQERGQIFSDVIYKVRPGADTIAIEDPGVNPQFVDLYNLGINLARPRTYDTAIVVFQRCNTVAPPDFAFAWEWMGQVYLSMKKYDEALQSYTRALAIDDWAVSSHTGLGNILFEQGRFAEAAGHFRKAVQYAPDDFEAYLNLSAALAKALDFAAAESALVQVRAKFPGVPDVDLRLAYVLMLAGKFDAAEADLNALLTRYPSLQSARQMLDQVRSRRASAGLPRP